MGTDILDLEVGGSEGGGDEEVVVEGVEGGLVGGQHQDYEGVGIAVVAEIGLELQVGLGRQVVAAEGDPQGVEVGVAGVGKGEGAA